MPLLTHEQFMILYIATGFIMLYGVNLTIRYRPYCILPLSERLKAIELHRKKILNFGMTSEEISTNSFYKKQTKLYTRGNTVLFLVTWIHLGIMLGNHMLESFPMYYCALFYAILYITPPSVYCINGSPFKSDNEYVLRYITAEQKNYAQHNQTKDEEKVFKQAEWERSTYIFMRHAINFGVVAHLVTDLWLIISNQMIKTFT